MGIRDEMEHNNNNWIKSDVEGWRTVPEKKSKARRKRLKIKEPSLETIYEDVSDTEVEWGGPVDRPGAVIANDLKILCLSG